MTPGRELDPTRAARRRRRHAASCRPRAVKTWPKRRPPRSRATWLAPTRPLPARG